MLKRAKEKQREAIEKAIQHIYRKMPNEEAALIEKFVQQYYVSAAPDDLTRLSVIDLYGSILSHWNFLNQRNPNETKVRVYNPQFEQHGWQSTHSVLEVITDDMPFLMDSVRMELNRRGLNLHLILHIGNMQVERDKNGRLKNVQFKKKKPDQGIVEAPLFIEFDRQSEPAVLDEIKSSIESILSDVRLCVEDWPNMLQKMEEVILEVEQSKTSDNQKEIQEYIDFLKWLEQDHFTFLGYCQLDIKENKEWVLVENSPLGLIKKGIEGYFDRLEDMPFLAKQRMLSKEHIILGKTNQPSKIHRPANPDMVAIKCFDRLGEAIGQHCFIGLYTSEAYNRSSQNIPLLNRKVRKILQISNFPPSSHDGKVIVNILETIPRDDLFQGTIDDLYRIAIGILYLQERRNIRLFIRKDIFGHYFSCLVFVPRDRFNSGLRMTFSKILEEELQGKLLDFNTRFSESILCRIHFIIQIDPKSDVDYSEHAIEERLKEAARTWDDSLKDALIDHFGEEEGNRLIHKYARVFPPGYRASFLARTAVYDISHIENLNETKRLGMSFYRPLEEAEGRVRLKLFHLGSSIALSDVIPMLENMGLRIIDERPHQITNNEGHTIWINDFGMFHESGADLNVEAVKDVFQEAFYNIWYGFAESDG
ncbi:MAG TPA: NAD-glutamate dehydrogenase, partial [Gammaproteobacteria bacterium]|nr:NAD-glutamate dehydrogenase [Gammaproteobacteria bacterium]